MHPLYFTGEIVQIAANLAIALGIWYAHHQFCSGQKDRDVHRENQQIQRFFYLHQYLAAKHFADARYHVRQIPLTRKTYKEWGELDKINANLVCSSYDQAGLLLLETRLLESKWLKSFLDSSWSVSICQQYEFLLNTYLKEEKIGSKTAEVYFKHFRSLYDEAKTYVT